MQPTPPAFGKTYGGTAPENYQRYFVPAIGAPLAADLLAAAGLRPGDRVLDVACGTGVLTRLAAERVGRSGTVAGLDINAAMLAVARAMTPPEGATIRWYETSAEAMPLPDDAFDVVTCQLGLEFVAEKGAALREMRRVLAPGGRAVVSVPTPNAFFDCLDAALARHVPAAAGFVRLVFSLNDPALIEQLFHAAGFAGVVVRSETRALELPAPQEFLWQYIHSTPLSGMVPGRDDPRGAALERDVAGAWQPWTRDGGMRYEQGVIVATARK